MQEEGRHDAGRGLIRCEKRSNKMREEGRNDVRRSSVRGEKKFSTRREEVRSSKCLKARGGRAAEEKREVWRKSADASAPLCNFRKLDRRKREAAG